MTRIPLWATALTLLGILILCTLGGWQLQRLQWKTSLLDKIETAYRSEPAALGFADLQQAFARNDTFFRGSITGVFLPGQSLRSSPRPLDGAMGAHLYMPLQMQDGGIILVNRGWVPADPSAKIDTPSGTVIMSGTFRLPEKPNRFTPPNNPERDEWYRIDTAQIAAVKGLNSIAPYVLYAETSPDGTWPKAIGGRPELNNNHLGYALFWFTMAGALAVIYYFRFIAGRRVARP